MVIWFGLGQQSGGGGLGFGGMDWVLTGWGGGEVGVGDQIGRGGVCSVFWRGFVRDASGQPEGGGVGYGGVGAGFGVDNKIEVEVGIGSWGWGKVDVKANDLS